MEKNMENEVDTGPRKRFARIDASIIDLVSL